MTSNYYFVDEIIEYYEKNLSVDVLVWKVTRIRYFRNFTYFLLFIAMSPLLFKDFLIRNHLKESTMWWISIFIMMLAIVLLIHMRNCIIEHLKTNHKIIIKKGGWNSSELYSFRAKELKKFLKAKKIQDDKIKQIEDELKKIISKEEPETVLGVRSVSAFLLVAVGSFMNALFKLSKNESELIQNFSAVLIVAFLIHFFNQQLVLGEKSPIRLLFKKYYELEDLRKLLVSTSFISIPDLE